MAGEAYSKRYGAGGFVDLPTQTTSIDSQFLNGVEAALARLLGVDPTADCVMVWDAGLGRFKTIKLVASEIDPAAGILKSQLAPLAISDADIAAGANIAASKLGGNIPVSKLSLPVTSCQILSVGSGTYTLPAGCRAIWVEAVGSGGGGGGVPAGGAGVGSIGGAGGGGAYAVKLIVAPSASYPYVVGAGGAGGAAGSNAGVNGNDTTFGATVVVAKAGVGGGAGVVAVASGGLEGSAGGVAASCTGDLTADGGRGEGGVWSATAPIFVLAGGAGNGAGPYGGGVNGGRTAGVAVGNVGYPGKRYGGAGTGAVALGGGAGAAAGGAGADGIIVVTEFY